MEDCLVPETGKAVERLNGSRPTASWLEEEAGVCRDGTSATRVKYDDMGGMSPSFLQKWILGRA